LRKFAAIRFGDGRSFRGVILDGLVDSTNALTRREHVFQEAAAKMQYGPKLSAHNHIVESPPNAVLFAKPWGLGSDDWGDEPHTNAALSRPCYCACRITAGCPAHESLGALENTGVACLTDDRHEGRCGVQRIGRGGGKRGDEANA